MTWRSLGCAMAAYILLLTIGSLAGMRHDIVWPVASLISLGIYFFIEP